MARKRKHPEHENLERWLISYADFITLLFAFFVVLYSMSSLNDGKYRVLSDSLTNIFENVPKTPEALESESQNAISEMPTTIDVQRDSPDSIVDLSLTLREKEKEKEKLATMADMIEGKMKGWIDEELIKVIRTERWLEIEIKSSLLYESGSAEVQPEAYPIIDKIAEILVQVDNYIQVEGFTDNVPIKGATYPSNWELSASRSASIVHLFMEDGIAPDRMAAIGYGEYRPIADNATREGRAQNRRVALIILADNRPEHVVDTQRESEINSRQNR